MKTLLHYEMNSRKQSLFVSASPRFRPLGVFLFVLAVFGMVCIVDRPVRADSINNPLYDVNGRLTITGNDVCGLSPCTETIEFSFEYTYTLNGFEYLGEVVGTPSVSSYGALGSFFAGITSPQNPFPFCQPNTNYMPMFNSGGDEIDLYACGNYQSTPVAPSFRADLWGCQTVTCGNDFMPPGSFCEPGPSQDCGALQILGTVQENVVAVPEGGTSLMYLAISLVPIGLAIRQSKRESVHQRN
jgi:hypothetical protein